MTQVSSVTGPSSFLTLRETFTRAVGQARTRNQPTLVCVSFSIAPIDPLHLLAEWDDGETPFFYWEGPEPDLTFLGWGCAQELTARGELRFSHVGDSWRTLCATAVVEGSCSPVLCGGFRFDPCGPRHTHWRDFGDASMMVANIAVLRQGKDHSFLCQHLITGEDDPIALAAQYTAVLFRLRRQPVSRPISPEPRHKPGGDLPNHGDRNETDRLDWEEKVEDAVRTIRDGQFEKVVLARTQVQATADPSPWQVIEHLRQHQHDTHLFACRRGHSCFLGSTPERLTSLRNGQVQTHALAGTIARGADPSEDLRLGEALLDDAKERHEHALVVDAIRGALHPLCAELNIPEKPCLKRLPRVQHLNTPIRGRVRDGIGLMDILQVLHPTPAVGGYPRLEAMAYIRQHENLDRGWYAAPMGWCDSNGNGDFVVALRSALVGNGESRLFAGCGLVRDSIPAHEYRETRMKVSTMDIALRAVASGQGYPDGRPSTVAPLTLVTSA